MTNESFDIEDSEFTTELTKLILITRKLQLYSMLIIILLLLCLVVLSIYAMIHRENARYVKVYDSSQTEMLGLGLIFGSALFAIFTLLAFNSQRNRGMIIYEELTDEIDWSRKRREFIHRPPIKTRIIIKEFLKATDLPFTSGTNGQAFYLLLFMLFIIAAILIKILI